MTHVLKTFERGTSWEVAKEWAQRKADQRMQNLYVTAWLGLLEVWAEVPEEYSGSVVKIEARRQAI